MTKEEILEDKNGFFYLEDTVYHEDGVKEAMDEFAKQEAIAFGIWINENGYRIHDRIFNTWENDNDIEVEFTTEQLYTLFLQSKQQ